jgi:hypothetical protein
MRRRSAGAGEGAEELEIAGVLGVGRWPAGAFARGRDWRGMEEERNERIRRKEKREKEF